MSCAAKLETAKKVLAIEAQAVLSLIPRLDETFSQAVTMILNSPGRVIVTGMGKSGLVGKKIAATLASTGTPSFFLHPGEALHGDLGMVTSQDIVLALSNSGETNEVLAILPALKRIGATLMVLCGQKDSTLVRNGDLFLDATVAEEACPLGLAPTASTTAALALGDALAVSLLVERKFTAQDFALFHPGGSLGRKLLLTVADMMHQGSDRPLVRADQTVKEALFVMTDKGLGATAVVDREEKLLGILTDGDIRRGLEKGQNFLDSPVSDIMTKEPKTISPQKLAASALHLMEQNKPRPITVLPVVNEEKQVIGMIHLTDLLRQGVV